MSVNPSRPPTVRTTGPAGSMWLRAARARSADWPATLNYSLLTLGAAALLLAGARRGEEVVGERAPEDGILQGDLHFGPLRILDGPLLQLQGIVGEGERGRAGVGIF